MFFIYSPDKKCIDFKNQFFCDVYIICSSNVFFINNPDPDPKLRLDPDQKKKISDPQHSRGEEDDRCYWYERRQPAQQSSECPLLIASNGGGRNAQTLPSWWAWRGDILYRKRSLGVLA